MKITMTFTMKLIPILNQSFVVAEKKDSKNTHYGNKFDRFDKTFTSNGNMHICNFIPTYSSMNRNYIAGVFLGVNKLLSNYSVEHL